jgi:hypothetical protein
MSLSGSAYFSAICFRQAQGPLIAPEAIRLHGPTPPHLRQTTRRFASTSFPAKHIPVHHIETLIGGCRSAYGTQQVFREQSSVSHVREAIPLPRARRPDGETFCLQQIGVYVGESTVI